MGKSGQTEKCHKGKDPRTCTAQEIKECHGDSKTHPCAGGNKK